MVRKKSDLRQSAHDRVDDAMDRVEYLNERGQKAMSQAKAKMQELREGADSYIERNPEKSVLIAAGIGAVVGSIITASIVRRRR